MKHRAGTPPDSLAANVGARIARDAPAANRADMPPVGARIARDAKAANRADMPPVGARIARDAKAGDRGIARDARSYRGTGAPCA